MLVIDYFAPLPFLPIETTSKKKGGKFGKLVAIDG